MNRSLFLICFSISIFLIILCQNANCRSVQKAEYPIRSDVVVTHWPDNGKLDEAETNEPGWMRKQLMRFGVVTSKIGNAMGSHATKITSAIDKVCEIVKTIIPLLAAVCHVGQFKFCSATEGAPGDLSDALSPTSLNLDDLDK